MKTAELTGAALDLAVATCEGLVDENGWIALEIFTASRGYGANRFSTNWAQGGPIIEREKVHLFQQESTGEWTATIARERMVGWRIISYGPTPLIAAMRCYVASKLGDEVDVPEELK